VSEENDWNQFAELVSRPLRDLVDCAMGYDHSHSFEPLPGSIADQERSRDVDYADEWGPTPAREAHQLAVVCRVAADDHLQSLARLIADPPAVYSTSVVARSASESAARAWWLLDPALTVEERIARGMTERVFSLTEVARLVDDDADVANGHLERRQAIVETARRRGMQVKSSKGRAPFIGEPRPSSTKLANDLHGGNENLGQFFYRLLSAVDHATTYALMQGVMTPPKARLAGSGDVLGQLVVRPELVRHIVSGTCNAYCNAFERQLETYGWDFGPWNAVKRQAFETLIGLQ